LHSRTKLTTRIIKSRLAKSDTVLCCVYFSVGIAGGWGVQPPLDVFNSPSCACLFILGIRRNPHRSQKNVKNTKFSCQHMGYLKLKMHQNQFSAGAPPRTPLDPLVGWGEEHPFPSPRSIYQCKEYEEASDISEHSSERDLQRTEHLEGRHQIRRPSDTPDVSQRKQHVRHDLWIIQRPVKTSCQSTMSYRDSY